MWIESYNTRRFGWEAVPCRLLEVAQVAWSVEGMRRQSGPLAMPRFRRYSGRQMATSDGHLEEGGGSEGGTSKERSQWKEERAVKTGPLATSTSMEMEQ